MPESLPWRVAVRTMRLVTAGLAALGLRETVIRARAALSRRRRRRAEAQGSDARSRPALHDLERKLDAVIDRDGGFFVEAGANDGFTQSNTYWLERFRGWSGVLVEPMPELYSACVLERPGCSVFRAALVAGDHTEPTVPMRFGDLMSAVKGSHADDEGWTRPGLLLGWRDAYEADVPARTLSSLLDAAGAPEVDLLSLDVEGYEATALAGLDLDRHAPRWILVEVHDEARDRPPIDAVLGDRYVVHDRLSPVDLLYRRSDVTVRS